MNPNEFVCHVSQTQADTVTDTDKNVKTEAAAPEPVEYVPAEQSWQSPDVAAPANKTDS